MDDILKEGQRLVSSKHVANPELTIFHIISRVNHFLVLSLPNSFSNDQIMKLFNIFQSFLVANESLSFQCIDNIIKLIAKININLLSTEFFNQMLLNYTVTCLYAASRILKHFRRFSTSKTDFNSKFSISETQLDHLIHVSLPELNISAMYLMRQLSKIKNPHIETKLEALMVFCLQIVQNSAEAQKISAIKLCKEIVSNYQLKQVQTIKNIIQISLLKYQTPFVKQEAISLCVRYSIHTNTNPISLANLFPNISLISQFFDLYIESDHSISTLINFAKAFPDNLNIINSIAIFSKTLSLKDRRELFVFFTTNESSVYQIEALSLLFSDEEELDTVAKHALNFLTKDAQKEIEIDPNSYQIIEPTLLNFCQNLPQVNGEIGFQLLSQLLRLEKQSMLTIKAIASLMINLHCCGDEIEKFLTDPLQPFFWLAFCGAPPDFVSKKPIPDYFKKVLSYLDQNKSIETPSQYFMFVESIFIFLTYHSDFLRLPIVSCTIKSILKTLLTRKNTKKEHLEDLELLSLKCQFSLFSLLPFLEFDSDDLSFYDNYVEYCYNFVLTHSPGNYFLRTLIKNHFLIADDLLKTEKYNLSNIYPPIKQQFSRLIIQNFDVLLSKSSQSVQNKIISDLVSKYLPQPDNKNSCQLHIIHSLIFRLVQNQKTISILPKNLLRLTLTSLTGSDNIRLELSCEIVSIMISNHNSYRDALLKFIEANKRAVSCILIGSIANYIKFTDKELSHIILFLEERVSSPHSSLFALHSLSILLKTHKDSIIRLSLGPIILQTLVDKLQSKTSLHPMILSSICVTFIYLLSIIANDSFCFEFIETAFTSIYSTPFSFAKKMFYKCIVVLFKISNTPKNIYIDLTFPKSPYCSSSLIAAAAQAFLFAAQKGYDFYLSEENVVSLISSLQFIEEPFNTETSNAIMNLVQSGKISSDVLSSAIIKCPNAPYMMIGIRISEKLNNLPLLLQSFSASDLITVQNALMTFAGLVISKNNLSFFKNNEIALEDIILLSFSLIDSVNDFNEIPMIAEFYKIFLKSITTATDQLFNQFFEIIPKKSPNSSLTASLCNAAIRLHKENLDFARYAYSLLSKEVLPVLFSNSNAQLNNDEISAFIWAEKQLANKNITMDAVFSSCVLLLEKKQNITAALQGMSTLLSESISSDVIESGTLYVISKIKELDNAKVKNYLLSLVENCPKSEKVLELVLTSLIQYPSVFSPKITGFLMNSINTQILSENDKALSSLFITIYLQEENSLSDQELIALFTILVNKVSQDSLQDIIDYVLSINDPKLLQIQFIILGIILKICNDIDMKGISDFCIHNFYPYGIGFASNLLKISIQKGLELAANNCLSASLNDGENHIIFNLCYLNEICNALSEIDDDFAQLILPMVFKNLTSSQDRQILTFCGSVLSFTLSKNKDKTKEFFEKEDENSKIKIIQILNNISI